MNTDIRLNSAEYLVERFLDDIIRLSLVYVRNMDDAQDVAQQVFVTYLQRKPKFEDLAHAKSWLTKVTVNISKNHMRAAKGNVSYDQLEGVLTDKAADNHEMTDSENAVFEAVMRLRRSYREVIHLYYYSGYETAEIAKILGISQVGVRSRLSRARSELKKELKGGNGSGE